MLAHLFFSTLVSQFTGSSRRLPRTSKYVFFQKNSRLAAGTPAGRQSPWQQMLPDFFTQATACALSQSKTRIGAAALQHSPDKRRAERLTLQGKAIFR
jgi:hypothetical protein